MRRNGFSYVVLAAALAASGPVFATGMNNSPPAGAILDLGGGETGTAPLAVNHGAPVPVSINFVAGVANTDITFAFREDPAFISFGQVSLVDTTNPGGNILTNGDFSGTTYNSGGNTVPTGWNYDNVYGAQASGNIQGCNAYSGAQCWYDGSVQAYDAIDQVVGTAVGDTYTLSFTYTDNGGLTTFSDLSTNGDMSDTGGNGIDILAYAQAGLPPACPPGTVCTGPVSPSPVPEPPAALIILGGMTALAALRLRRVPGRTVA